MTKQLLNSPELDRQMTRMMQNEEGCEGCSIAGSRRVPPDEMGCNWRPGNIHRSAPPAPPDDVWKPAFQRVYEEAMRNFNLI